MRAVTDQDVVAAKAAASQAKTKRATDAGKAVGSACMGLILLEAVVLEALGIVALVKVIRK